MKTKCLFMKTECEIFFPSLIIRIRIAVKPSKPFNIQQSRQCCYNTESEYQALLDWYWHGQIAVLQRRPFECVSLGRRKWRHGQVKKICPWCQSPSSYAHPSISMQIRLIEIINMQTRLVDLINVIGLVRQAVLSLIN
jgi:hypothetical protein